MNEDEQSDLEDDIPPEECMDFGPDCAGPVELHGGIRLANVQFARCRYHRQRYLEGANFDGALNEQAHLHVENPDS